MGCADTIDYGDDGLEAGIESPPSLPEENEVEEKQENLDDVEERKYNDL